MSTLRKKTGARLGRRPGRIRGSVLQNRQGGREMDYEQVLYEVEERILTLTLNRPQRLNAFTPRMFAELMDSLDRADADDEIRAIIVTGAGRGFCAGADLEAGASTWKSSERTPGEAAAEPTFQVDPTEGDLGGQLTRRMYDLDKPIIAAINGPAVGVGLTMTLAMDVRLAVPGAKLGFVFVQRGIVPEACSAWFLPRIVGISQALEWALSGEVFTADEGLRGDLLRSLHEPENLLPEARRIAHNIAQKTSAVSVALTRHMMWKMLGADHPVEAHKIDTRGILATGNSKDAAEGIKSFLEKRPPHFTDRVSRDMPDFFPWWDKRKLE